MSCSRIIVSSIFFPRVKSLHGTNHRLRELVNYLEEQLEADSEERKEEKPQLKPSHQLWDENAGVSGGFSASLRLLVMKLRRQNIAISKISSVIALFVEHFDLEVDLSRLPSTRTISRIVTAELSILTNAHIGLTTASAAEKDMVWGHDESSLRGKKIVTNQIYISQHLMQMDMVEIPNKTGLAQADAMVWTCEQIQRDSSVLPSSLATPPEVFPTNDS